jgi:hypothetical protein
MSTNLRLVAYVEDCVGCVSMAFAAQDEDAAPSVSSALARTRVLAKHFSREK